MNDLTAKLLSLAHQVQTELGRSAVGDADTPLADMFDSMGLVEYLLVVADAMGVSVQELEQSVGRRFSTIGELSRSGLARGTCAADASGGSRRSACQADAPVAAAPSTTPGWASASPACWLAAVTARLPRQIQTGEEIDRLLARPPGWWQTHAGIAQRRVWGDQDALGAAAAAASDCLAGALLSPADVGLLLTVSEAPPLLVGLAAAVHLRLELAAHVPALELGNACNGFLTAMWLARSLAPRHGHVLIVCIEAPSRYLRLEPGPTGEAAALFGDGAAACVVTGAPITAAAGIRLLDIELQTDGASADLIRAEHRPDVGVELHLQGPRLAAAAVRSMAEAARALLARHKLAAADLEAVVMHAGNGRFPALLARELNLPAERLRSQTACNGNLGSASLPAAWALPGPAPGGLVLWTAVGAGITSAAALTQDEPGSP